MGMTKAMKDADIWLNRAYGLNKELDANVRTLNKLMASLNSGVARYESDGTESHDPERAKTNHEDTLLEYSEQMARVEKLRRNLKAENIKTIKAIDQLSSGELRAIATDRYINCMTWKEIAKAEYISKSEVDRRRTRMLEQMANILPT
jgi:DNA-directed RNA polymerase specialized sigma subunit